MTKKPRPMAGAGLSLSIAADNEAPTRKTLNLQPLDEVARLRALHLVARLHLAPDTAVLLAALAFGGAR